MILDVANPIPLRIRRTEEKERKGSQGSWRRQFCSEYARRLNRARENAIGSLLESLSAQGKQPSCREGCTWCCYHYVTVSLAHGIVIADYLYRRKDLLKQFLDRYEDWSKQGASIADDIDHIRNQALTSSTPTGHILGETRPLSMHYLEANIPCPFLADDRCSIYPVRPMSCSGHHSVSPPDWCAPASQHKPDIRLAEPDDQDLIALAQLADPRLTLYELSLPTMVYRLLTEGSAAMMAEISQLDLA